MAPIEQPGNSSPDPSAARASAGFDSSYFGVYKSYPPEQESADKAPLSFETIDQDEGQAMGGIYRINARVTTAKSPRPTVQDQIRPDQGDDL